MTIVQIVCQHPGLRRAGRTWPATTPRVDWDALSEIQQRQISAEPALVVTPAAPETDTEAAPADAAPADVAPEDVAPETDPDTEAAPTAPAEDAAAPQQGAGRRRK